MNFTIFDAHCDTINEVFEQDLSLRNNSLSIDLERLHKCGQYIQTFAMYVDKTKITTSPLNHVLKLIHRYYKEIDLNGDIISHCQNIEDVNKALSNGKLASILSIEGGEALDGNISALWMFYQLGVRMITLTWNNRNEICDGICEVSGGGLTVFGYEVVKEMNDLGMIIDVSHLSEKGFWDVIENSNAPIVATHSNAKSLCGHIRNLTDEQIRAIIKNNGCIGINFYPGFLTNDTECTSDDIIKHIDYMLSLGAENNIGLGSDFDGISEYPSDVKSVQDMNIIIEKMLKNGYSESLVSKITSNNFLRIISEIL